MSPVQRPIAAVRDFLEDPGHAAHDAARNTISNARDLDLGVDGLALIVIELVRATMDKFFLALGLLPTTDFELATAMSILVVGATLLAYFALFGKKHRRDRQQLRKELAAAATQMQHLQELIDAEDYHSLNKSNASGKEIRVFVEGAFDVMHYGHANAFRQARALGTYLVAGVNSSESVEECKGAPPIMSDDERVAVVRACKWVDEVVPRTPYVMTPEYLDWVIKTYRIDFVVHGDDPCIGPDGKDVYADVKARGLFRSIPRTEGVSTTEIVGRMLLMSTRHHLPSFDLHDRSNDNDDDSSSVSSEGSGTGGSSHGIALSQSTTKTTTAAPTHGLSPFGPYRESRFLTTSRMIRLFSQPPPKPIAPGMKVVYICGGFDMFHAGHASILEKARALGDYLLVGVYNDGVCNHYRGGSHPVLNLNERVLSVLACKWVDDVILDPPYFLTQEMIAALSISVVVAGRVTESIEREGSNKDSGGVNSNGSRQHRSNSNSSSEGNNVYAAAADAGILKVVDSGSTLTMSQVLSRIKTNAERLEAKVNKKMKAEGEFYKEKHGLLEYATGSN